ncbi:MAG: response regulator [Lachnospiraceae bacterium]|nr:response regulator [Lachnospiraceae bacterium]
MYRVLIVDDEKVERSGIRFLLKQLGTAFEIEEFPNGKAAWDWLSTQKADILLTDVKMPFMDGMELIRLAHGKDPEMKIVIFSGYGEFEYARTAMKYHVESYILKPVDPQEFEQTMRNVLNELDQRKQEPAKGEPVPGHSEIDTVKQYICQNYEKDLSIEKLAQLVYMAPAYLSTLFKKETGQNLSKFIKEVRMKKAKELLEGSHRKIVDISNAVGYPNVSYFCQSFREYFGVSPQKFRSKGEE